jgi:hypothetical protein
MEPTSPATVVVAVANQVSCDLDGDAAILHLASGVYYGLNPVGAMIWNMIQTPKTVDEIRQAIVARYDVEPEQCGRDLDALLKDLGDAQLIEMRVEPSA